MSVIGSNILAGASGQGGGYNLTNSLRFRSSASAYLNRTATTPTNAQKGTYSAWIKRGKFTQSTDPNNGDLVGSGESSGYALIQYYGQNLYFGERGSNGYFSTAAVYRDPSSWYHVLCVFDTTLATANDRLQVWVNNVRQTAGSFNVAPTQNSSFKFLNENGQLYNIGAEQSSTTVRNNFDGYMAEVNFIDGQALTPSSFGETSATTGVWIPKKYTGTYGTNGFYLPFTDNSALTTSSNAGLGKDFSGNSNYWTTNNISITSGSTYDSMTDVPTLTSATAANYCVLNPLSKGANVSATNGNLNAVISGGSAESLQSTLGMSSGKWYCEMTAGGGGSIFGITTAGANLSSWVGSDTKGYGYRGDTGAVMYNSSALVSGMSTFASGDIISLAFDADTGKLWFAKNGTYYNSGNPATGTNATVSSIASETWFVSVGRIASTNDAQFNFGQQPFTYTPPTGFNRLNTFNLPTPTIGATASTTANKYFDASLYTGNSGTQSITNSGSMQPDFVWLKSRSNALDHGLFDSVRGVQNVLASNGTGAANYGGTGELTAFNSNGFTLVNSGSYQTNQSGYTYVAWQWRANGTPAVTNTAGSITSTVSANTTAGFSIVTYTGNGANSTVGHGLGVAPSIYIVKRRNNVDAWFVYSNQLAATQYLRLNSTNAAATFNFWQNTAPTSSVFYISTDVSVNASSDTYVAYCFAQIAGYSAFGSYTGNGSADGPFIFTGFRPRFVLIKLSSAGGTNWQIYDSARNTYNATDLLLLPSSSSAEGTFGSYPIDLTSNGFKIRGTGNGLNDSGQTLIYMAFAETPLKFSNAR